MIGSTKKSPASRWRLIAIALLLLGIGLVIFGLAMHLLVIPMFVRDNIRENAKLIEGSRLMNKWMKPEYEVLYKIYVHSIENPDEIMNGAIPEVNETGPYTFTKTMNNKVISHENGIVKFKRILTYVFNETESCSTCALGNRIWIPNMIYQVCEIPFMNFVCDSILDLPDRIGMFYEVNNTADGVYEIHDGVDNPKDLGKVETWNGKNSVDHSWYELRILLVANVPTGSHLPFSLSHYCSFPQKCQNGQKVSS
ncbi:unnamed protein product [Haemonchus placei]|uniref:Scavenger receptor class B member 2 n=1 Tax=Haemonchus placei TaxID=6290 RepID=A0A0N4WV10_HAEPC|nr:unnamed protein product [Haemonchus placei]